MLRGLTLSFLKSRQKTMLRRRRRNFRSRPQTPKRLEEERKIGNYAFEMKKMQIKRDLDRKRSSNHHLNEII